MLERNAAHPQKNIQPRGGFGEGLYRSRGKQIIQRIDGQNYRGEVQNNQKGLSAIKYKRFQVVDSRKKARKIDRAVCRAL